jgi:dihydrofolate reductase
MSKLKVCSFGVSIDGFGAGPRQDLQNPLGVGGEAIHAWFFRTRRYHEMVGKEGGETGTDNDFAVRGFKNAGAWIIGRNMFGPVRGPRLDESWRGWWGENPPFHTPVFVLTHHARTPLVMQGGTTFHFVTDGIHSALEKARAAANGKEIRLGGGIATIHQFLRAGLVDEMHLVIAPVLMGAGEKFFGDIDLPALGFRCAEHKAGERAMHVVLHKEK